MFFSSLSFKKIGILLFCILLITPLFMGINSLYKYNITEPIKVHITTNEGIVRVKHYPYLNIEGVDVKVDDDTFQSYSVGSYASLGINKIKNKEVISNYLNNGFLLLLLSIFSVSFSYTLIKETFFNKRK